jgi:hypothetical protein
MGLVRGGKGGRGGGYRRRVVRMGDLPAVERPAAWYVGTKGRQWLLWIRPPGGARAGGLRVRGV